MASAGSPWRKYVSPALRCSSSDWLEEPGDLIVRQIGEYRDAQEFRIFEPFTPCSNIDG